MGMRGNNNSGYLLYFEYKTLHIKNTSFRIALNIINFLLKTFDKIIVFTSECLKIFDYLVNNYTCVIFHFLSRHHTHTDPTPSDRHTSHIEHPTYEHNTHKRVLALTCILVEEIKHLTQEKLHASKFL